MNEHISYQASFVQLWHYFNRYQKDFPLVKLLVAIACVCMKEIAYQRT